jgi:hypothetical protein
MKLYLGLALLVGSSPLCFGANVLEIQGEVQLGSNYVDFGKWLTGGPFTPAPGYGEFEVTVVSPGSLFANGGVTSGEIGQIQSLNEGTGPVTLPSALITFGPNGPNLPLTLTNIAQGAFGAFNVQDTSQGALVTAEGSGYTGSNPGQNPFTIELSIGTAQITTTQLFHNLPLDEHFCAVIAISGAPTTCDPFPSTPPTTTPEPGYAAVGILFAAVVAVADRRRIATKHARSDQAV